MILLLTLKDSALQDLARYAGLTGTSKTYRTIQGIVSTFWDIERIVRSVQGLERPCRTL